MAIALGTPRDIRMGRTITPMAITGPAPVMAVKMKAVTTFSRTMVMMGRIAAQLNSLTDQGGSNAGLHQDAAETRRPSRR